MAKESPYNLNIAKKGELSQTPPWIAAMPPQMSSLTTASQRRVHHSFPWSFDRSYG